MPRFASLVAAALLLGAACSTSNVASVQKSPSPVTGGLVRGVIAYVADGGVGVLDPASGKSIMVAPLPPGAFRASGPVWGPAPDVDHPVIYFTVHDNRAAERRTTAGVVPYDWLFRVDPFAGTIEPVAASQDLQSQGPIGLVANDHYLAMSYGCCAGYEVDVLDLTKKGAPLKAQSKPPQQAAFFSEGIVPGDSTLIAVRAAGTGAWYWLNAEQGVLHPFPLKLGQDDGPVAISADGTMAAVALPVHGALIEPINSALPLVSPTAGASPSATASASPHPTPRASQRVNSKLLHPDGLSFSPDSNNLAVAANGEIQLYRTGAADGPPANRYLVGAGVTGLAWSGSMAGRAFTAIKASAGPLATVDALLNATRLPAAADTPANRPFTLVYLWQFDSTKTSPIATIADASASTLAAYPPLAAGVFFHHWAPADTWALLGGCYRYRVVIAGTIAPVASTIGLSGSRLCSAQPTPTPSSSARATPS